MPALNRSIAFCVLLVLVAAAPAAQAKRNVLQAPASAPAPQPTLGQLLSDVAQVKVRSWMGGFA